MLRSDWFELLLALSTEKYKRYINILLLFIITTRLYVIAH